jgi:hypothetical protein
MTAKKPLTKTEKEVLADLYEVEEAFADGSLKGGTRRSHVMFRMANRRGRTRPAPVHGKVQSDSAFSGVFTRTINRLVSRKLVRKLNIKDDFSGLPYQWGFANHAKRDKDICLTEEGRETGAPLAEERAQAPPQPAPAPAGTETTAQPNPQPPHQTGPPLIQYFTPPHRAARHMSRLVGRHTVDMGGFTVTYFYTKKTR